MKDWQDRVEKLEPALRRMAQRRLRALPDAEGEASEVILKVCEWASEWEGSLDDFAPLCWTVAKRQALMILRKAKSRPKFQPLPEVIEQPDRGCSEGVSLSLLESLHSSQADAIRFRVLEGCTWAEVASRVGKSAREASRLADEGLAKLRNKACPPASLATSQRATRGKISIKESFMPFPATLCNV